MEHVALFLLLLLAGALLGMVFVWLQLRALLRAWLGQPLRVEWAPEWKMPEGLAADLDAEWRSLDYREAGVLQSEHGDMAAVYRHPTLPIYAVIEMPARGQHSTYALTFFEDQSRLLTTSSPFMAWSSACAGRVPRLSQLRVRGRPKALDGQHVGTVRAWEAGKRVPLAVPPEQLPERLRADREFLRQCWEDGARLSLADALRILAGTPKGVLKF